jgi:hypothetical protein
MVFRKDELQAQCSALKKLLEQVLAKPELSVYLHNAKT